MKILFTQHGLVNTGGTELFVAEVTSALRARGHDVAVYAGKVGEPAECLRRRGVIVVTDPRDCPWEPDIIHGQHRIHALKGLIAFPECPAVLHLHGLLPELEKPFLHPRIRKYIVTSPWLAQRWSNGLGLPSEKFETVLNHVDTLRFATVKTPPPKPRKALAYGNSGINEQQASILRGACGDLGLELSLAGMASGGYESAPEKLLPRYDVVFSVGRCALEAAVTGCGVILVYGNMSDELLTMDNYERLRAQNMSVRISRHEKLTSDWIKSQLGRWDAAEVSRVGQQVRKDTSLEHITSRLETLYQKVIEDHTRSSRAPLEDELRVALAVLGRADRQELFLANEHTRKELNNALLSSESYERGRRRVLARISSMENSWSWRITAPFRLVRHVSRLVSGLALRKRIAKIEGS